MSFYNCKDFYVYHLCYNIRWKIFDLQLKKTFLCKGIVILSLALRMLIDRFKGVIIEGLGRVDYYIQRGLLWVWEEALENSWVASLHIELLIFCNWHLSTPSHGGVRLFKITNLLYIKINVWIDYLHGENNQIIKSIWV